jgi:hypothetical protein
MKTDKRLLIATLGVGFLVGFFVATLGSNRYQLKDSGTEGILYKVDTRTGQTWVVAQGGEMAVKEVQ